MTKKKSKKKIIKKKSIKKNVKTPIKPYKRRKIEHSWPKEGEIIIGRLKGHTFRGKIVRDPDYIKEHGRAIQSIDNKKLPLGRTMREAIIIQTEKIQKKYNLKPIANAWKWWRRKSDNKRLFDIPEYTRVKK